MPGPGLVEGSALCLPSLPTPRAAHFGIGPGMLILAAVASNTREKESKEEDEKVGKHHGRGKGSFYTRDPKIWTHLHPAG